MFNIEVISEKIMCVLRRKIVGIGHENMGHKHWREREREDGVNTLGHKSRRVCVLSCNCQHRFEIIGHKNFGEYEL